MYMFNYTKTANEDWINKGQRTKMKEEESIPVVAVIDGLLYDTSKASKVFTYSVENDDMGVSGMCTQRLARLFRTKNQRFFILQDSRIYPCDEEKVKKILSYSPDKYQEIFGGVEEA